MATLKTLKTIPPGGWRLPIKLPNGTIFKFESMGPFGDAVKAVQRIYRANGIEPSDEESIADQIIQHQCQRLGNDPNWVEDKKKRILDRVVALPSHVRQVVREGAKLAAAVGEGARIMSDWVGEGCAPVEPKLAAQRESVCLTGAPDGGRCPFNVESHGGMKLTERIAHAILEQRRLKSQLGLSTPGESRLNSCEVCWCHLPLKIWVPMKTIMGDTKPEKLKKFPAYCWMNTENPQPKEQNAVVNGGPSSVLEGRNVGSETPRVDSRAESDAR